jgi:streptogramin lyase
MVSIGRIARPLALLSLSALLALAASGMSTAVRGIPHAKAAFGDITEYTPPNTGGTANQSMPTDIVNGPDGAVWFAERNGKGAGRITPAGVITEPIRSPNTTAIVDGITVGPDNNIWFTESQGGSCGASGTGSAIGKFTPPSGPLVEFRLPPWTETAGPCSSGPTYITAGPDGALWFTERRANKIGRITTDGLTINEYPLPAPSSNPRLIHIISALGFLFFTEQFDNKIGRITTGGVINEYPLSPSNLNPSYLAFNPADNLIYFSEYGCQSDVGSARKDCNPGSPAQAGNKIGKLNPADGTFADYLVPTNNSKPSGLVFDSAGLLWFAEQAGNKVGTFNRTSLAFTEYPVPSAASLPTTIAMGPDGNVWFTEFFGEGPTGGSLGGKIGKVDTGGSPGGNYTPLVPARILDTRNGTGGYLGSLGPNSTITVQVLGAGGVPGSGVGAVALNVTADGGTDSSFLTIFPGPGTVPLVSNLNFVQQQTIANMVVVNVGTDGQVRVYNARGNVHVIIDVNGWFSNAPTGGAAGTFNPVAPARLLDTRTTTGGHPGRMTAGETYNLPVAGVAGLPAVANISSVIINLTASGPSQAAFLTAFPGGSRPTASNLNVQGGVTQPNRVAVKLAADGTVSIFLSDGSADVVVDVNGWFGTSSASAGVLYHGLVPTRIYDSRSPGQSMLGPDQTRPLQIRGLPGVPTGATAMVGDVAVTDSNSASVMIIYPTDAGRPVASDLNWPAGATIPNLVVVKIGADGNVAFYNAVGSTNFVVDVSGWFG